MISPYDAELYGHWWYEGPAFLDMLIRKSAFDQGVLQMGGDNREIVRVEGDEFHRLHGAGSLPSSFFAVRGS